MAYTQKKARAAFLVDLGDRKKYGPKLARKDFQTTG